MWKHSDKAARPSSDQALFAEQERLRAVCNAVADAVMMVDAQGRVTLINRLAQELTGCSEAQALGQPLLSIYQVVDAETGNSASNPALSAMAENRAMPPAANGLLRRADGTEIGVEDSAAPITDHQGQVVGAVMVFRDISQSLATLRKMAWLARHDALTGLASRTLFAERFRQVASLASRQGGQAALLFVDLDDFKRINDRFGHRMGDQVLQAVARVLNSGVRDTDTLCRYGGDEFVILLADVVSLAAAEQAAQQLLSLFAHPLQVDQQQVQVAMSVGISMYPNDGREMQALIERADMAMYQAKQAGKNSCGVYSPIRPVSLS